MLLQAGYHEAWHPPRAGDELQEMNSESIHIEADAPIIGMRITFVEGLWGGNEDSIENLLDEVVGDNGSITITDVDDDGKYVRVVATGDGDDMDYLSLADRIMERFNEYMPQIEILTDEEDE